MKIVFTVFLLITSLTNYAQNIDWVNAPINPVPLGSDLKYENLKGDVFQEIHTGTYTKDGQWHPYNTNMIRVVDNQGRVIKLENGNQITQYFYDEKGNLIEQKKDNKPFEIYEYDSLNRIIKATYLHSMYTIKSTTYTYEQLGNICKVYITNTYKNGNIEKREQHFENGNIIYNFLPGQSSQTYTYQFDQQGNWISNSTFDAETKQPILGYDGKEKPPFKRNIIYHNEYGKGLQTLTVQMTDISDGYTKNAPLYPIPYINGKQLYTADLNTRFLNDFIFYDPISKTYYIARDAYLDIYTINQKIPVEVLISGSENILLLKGTKVKTLEYGNEGKLKDWKFLDYTEDLNLMISINKNENKSYAFLNLPKNRNEKVIAVPGKSINGLWYIFVEDKLDVHLFDNGEYIRAKYTVMGKLDNSISNDLVVSVEGASTYVLPQLGAGIDKHFYKARLFNPSKDKLVSNSTNEKPGNGNLSSEARTFINAYNNNPDNISKQVRDLLKVITENKAEGETDEKMFLRLVKEIYNVDKYLAFLTVINADKKLVDYVLPNISKDMRSYFKKEAIDYNIKLQNTHN